MIWWVLASGVRVALLTPLGKDRVLSSPGSWLALLCPLVASAEGIVLPASLKQALQPRTFVFCLSAAACPGPLDIASRSPALVQGR